MRTYATCGGSKTVVNIKKQSARQIKTMASDGGTDMTRLEELKDIFAKVDPEKAAVISPLLPQVVFMEDRLEELQKVPHIRIHPKNPARQEITAAGKQYKETMQAYLNAIKVLQNTLGRYAVEEKDAFDEWLEQNK